MADESVPSQELEIGVHCKKNRKSLRPTEALSDGKAEGKVKGVRMRQAGGYSLLPRRGFHPSRKGVKVKKLGSIGTLVDEAGVDRRC